MKKFKISYLWLLMLLPLIGACSKEDIVFDVELPRFELRPGYQLLMPCDSAATHHAY